MADPITKNIACFAVTTQYENLPPFVVRECKKLFLDTLGCALGGIKTRKGRIAIQMARSLGGPPEASLLGTRDKVSAVSAAFAAGELMNALDYESLLSPPDHATPYVLAAPLSLVEMNGVSGKEFIVAIAIAHELATRLGSSLIFGSRFAVNLPERGMAMSFPTPGFGLAAFGGVAAAGRIMGLSEDTISHALGITGYHIPIPMVNKFTTTVPVPMSKYLSAGLLSQLEVFSTQLAEKGYTGDTEPLAGEYGFWKAFGGDAWNPDLINEGLGQNWHFPERIFYKAFPCCGAMQNTIAHFNSIIDENDLQPEDISEVTVKLGALAELPVWRTRDVETHIDAQFSVLYVFSVAAHRIEIGPSWQMEETIKDHRITEFMKKVNVITPLDKIAREKADVEVVVGNGASRKVYAKTGLALGYEMTDTMLREKFRRNSGSILSENQVEKVTEAIMKLEEFSDVTELLTLINDVSS